MCSSQALQLIEDEIAQRVSDQEMFTAFDVSKAVQEGLTRQSLPFERHLSLRNDIHNELENYSLDKTLISVGGSRRAYLYHESGADTDQYVPQGQSSSSNASPVPSNQPTGSSGPQQQNNLRVPDLRGSISVPAKLIGSVGLGNQNKVSVYFDTDSKGNHLVVDSDPPRTARIITEYTVNSHKNVRITRRPLKRISANSYSFEVFQHKVIVRPV